MSRLEYGWVIDIAPLKGTLKLSSGEKIPFFQCDGRIAGPKSVPADGWDPEITEAKELREPTVGDILFFARTCGRCSSEHIVKANPWVFFDAKRNQYNGPIVDREPPTYMVSKYEEIGPFGYDKPSSSYTPVIITENLMEVRNAYEESLGWLAEAEKKKASHERVDVIINRETLNFGRWRSLSDAEKETILGIKFKRKLQ